MKNAILNGYNLSDTLEVSDYDIISKRVSEIPNEHTKVIVNDIIKLIELMNNFYISMRGDYTSWMGLIPYLMKSNPNFKESFLSEYGKISDSEYKKYVNEISYTLELKQESSSEDKVYELLGVNVERILSKDEINTFLSSVNELSLTEIMLGIDTLLNNIHTQEIRKSFSSINFRLLSNLSPIFKFAKNQYKNNFK